MILTNFNGQAIYLFDVEPNWTEGFGVDVAILASADKGLSNRETRRALGQTLRFKTRYTVHASDAVARRIAGALKAQTNEPLVIPFWPAACKWSDRAGRPIGGGLNVV